MRPILKTLTLLFLSLCSRSVAQTISGAEIYYDKLGQSTYQVTAIVYRDCQSAPLNALNGFVIADTFRIPLNLKRESISRINDTCGNPCKSLNTASNFGFEKHVYLDTVDFSSSPYDSIPKANLCQVRFAIHQKLRVNSITTHDLHGQMVYVDAMLNICSNYSSIHSPKFSYDPRMVVSCNQPVNYTPGPLDTMDYDSLGFELDAVLYDYNKPVTYTGSFTKLIPLTPYCPPNPGIINCRALPNAKPPRGMFFDADVCQTGFTPTKCDEISTLKFKVSEYRRDSTGKFQLLGYVCREMTIMGKPMPDNNPPSRSGSNKFNVCENNKICFSSSYKDDPFLPKQTIPDTVFFDWNQGVPGADFKVLNPNAREKDAEFCWTASPSLKKERYVFATRAIDKTCNYMLNTHGFFVHLRGTTQYSTKNSLGTCNLLKFSASPLDSSESLNGSISVRNSKNKVIYSSSRTSDSFTVQYDGPIYISYSFRSDKNPYCFINKTDTVYVSGAVLKAFEFDAVDTNVCNTYPAQLSFLPSAQNNISYWEWYRNDTLINNTDSIINSNIYYNSLFNLILYSNQGCTSISSRRFIPYKLNISLLPPWLTLCENTKYSLVATLSQLKAPITKEWTYLGNKIQNIDTLNFIALNSGSISLNVSDDNHCKVTDVMQLYVNPYVDFSSSYDHDKYCSDSLLRIKLHNIKAVQPYGIYWKLNGKDSLGFIHKDTFTVKMKKPVNIIVTVTDKYYCTLSDTLSFELPDQHKYSIIDSGSFCAGHPLQIRLRLHERDTAFELKLKWKIDGDTLSNKDTVLNLVPSKNFHLELNASEYCPIYENRYYKINPSPEFKIISDTFYNYLNLIELSTDKYFKTYQWSNGSSAQYNQFWAYSLGAPGKYPIWCEVSNTFGCKSRQELHIFTDRNTAADKLSLPSFKLYPNPFESVFYLETQTSGALNVYSSDGRLLRSMLISEGLSSIDLGDSASGVYFVEFGGRRVMVLKG